MHLTKEEKNTLRNWIKPYNTSRGQRWKVCVPDGVGGQIREQGFESEHLALIQASSLYRQKLSNEGVIQSSSNITFGEFAKEWLQNKGTADLRTQSVSRYELELRLHLLPDLGNIKLRDLRKPIVRQYLAQRRKNGSTQNQVYYAGMMIKQIIKSAEQDDLIPPSGIRDLIVTKPRPKEPKFLSPREMERTTNYLRDHPNLHTIAFALLTGMRAGEVAALKWDSVFPNEYLGSYRGYIWVRRSLEQKTRQVVDTTKNGDKRKIPIFSQLLEFLPVPGDPQDYVFGGKTPMHTAHFARITKTVLRRLQLEELTYHQLRHSACSYWASLNIPQRIISEMMGHRSSKTTERYSHVKDEMVGEAILKVLPGGKQNSNNVLKTDFLIS